MKRDGKEIPREAKVETEGLIYTISVSVEAPVTIKSEGRSGKPLIYPRDNSTLSAFLIRNMRAETLGK